MGSKSKKKVLFLVAGGGFQWESLTLAYQLAEDWTFTYVVPESSVYPGAKLMESLAGSDYIVMPEVSSRADSRLFTVGANLWRGLGILWKRFSMVRPDAAVCVGSSMSIPIAFVCRLRGVPFFLIESITRTDSLSNTSKLLLRLGMVQRYFVQWPEQEKLHSKAHFKGTVL